MPHTIDGFYDGQRVRDTRTGMKGRVRFLDVPAGADPDEYELAEVVWDGSFVQDGLSVAAPFLEPVLEGSDAR